MKFFPIFPTHLATYSHYFQNSIDQNQGLPLTESTRLIKLGEKSAGEIAGQSIFLWNLDWREIRNFHVSSGVKNTIWLFGGSRELFPEALWQRQVTFCLKKASKSSSIWVEILGRSRKIDSWERTDQNFWLYVTDFFSFSCWVEEVWRKQQLSCWRSVKYIQKWKSG